MVQTPAGLDSTQVRCIIPRMSSAVVQNSDFPDFEQVKGVEAARVQQRKRVCPFNISSIHAKAIDRVANADRDSFFQIQPATQVDQALLDALKPGNGNGKPLTAQEQAEQYKELCERIFSEAFAEENMSLEDLKPQRVRVAWRICREIGRIKGQVPEDEMLFDCLQGHPGNIDPWQIPERFKPPVMQSYLRSMSQEAIYYMVKAETTLPECLQHCEYDDFNTGTFKYTSGLGILPPIVPKIFRDDHGKVKDDYNPETDVSLSYYTKMIEAIIKELHIFRSGSKNPNEGRLGLIGLLDPTTIRLAFPSRIEICTWEGMLVEEACQWLVEHSQQRVRQQLHDHYGLMPHECLSVIKMAKIHARKQLEGDTEEDKAIMVMRLEDFAKRARGSLDIRAELAALKQLSIIQGLARIDADDWVREMVDSIRVESKRRQALQKEADTPQIEVIDVTPSQ